MRLMAGFWPSLRSIVLLAAHLALAICAPVITLAREGWDDAFPVARAVRGLDGGTPVAPLYLTGARPRMRSFGFAMASRVHLRRPHAGLGSFGFGGPAFA